VSPSPLILSGDEMVMELVLETDKEKLLGLKFAFVLLLDP